MLTALDLPSLYVIGPELWLGIGAMVLLMIGVFGSRNATTLVTGLAVALIVVAGVSLWRAPDDVVALHGAFILDPFAKFMKMLALVGSAVTIAMSVNFMRREKFEKFEYPILVVLATTGMLLMISANSMLTLYLGLELQSLALYVCAALNRESTKASEAGLKYFVLGALSSGMLLYGITLVYGYTGQTTFAGIAEALSAADRSLGLIFGLVFILAGIAFKISAVPFHMW
ncbi:MAG: NADH-quinone oxidoreductase subunit N, partial [Nitratireductor sp.]|nr:NADH-quinone oxidoreductase subunit N [Nitratireductor sp.]